jgi:hypothetical protein
MHCENCGARSPEFRYLEHWLCCECMAALCSWFLDGGFRDDPDLFAHLDARVD